MDLYLHRYQAGFEDQRLVQEPRRQAVDYLVAGVRHGLERQRNRGEPAGGKEDVLGPEGHIQQPFKGLRGRFLRRPDVGFVGKPLVITGNQGIPQSGDVAVRRHLVGVAEREVADGALVLSPVKVPPDEGVNPLERGY
nr:hypothetical protein GCM10017547_27270 [Pseudarthrobacter oxydans]